MKITKIVCLAVCLIVVCKSGGLRAEALDVFLLSAVGRGDVKNVEYALKLGANPNCVADASSPLQPGERFSVYNRGDSPLSVATVSANKKCIQLLLDSGADPLLTIGQDPWRFALALTSRPSGIFHKEAFDLLLSAVDKLPRDSDAIIDYIIRPAAKRGDFGTLKKIGELGVNLGGISKVGNCVASAAAEGGFYKEAIAWLEKNKTQFSQIENNSIRIGEAVEYAAGHGWEDLNLAKFIEQIKIQGFKYREKNRRGVMVWRRAIAYHLPSTAEALDAPAQDVSDVKSLTVEEMIFLAARKPKNFPKFKEFVDQVLSKADSPDEAASRLFVALAGEVRKTNKLMLEYLLKQGADVNTESKKDKRSGSRFTALQSLVRKGDVEMAEWLLKRGADINHINSDPKRTVLMNAIMRGEEELIWAFAHGAKVQELQTGLSLIRLAIDLEEVDALIPILIKQGADPYLHAEQYLSVVDELAKRHDIRRLRVLDSKGRYRKLVAKYTPAPGSPFVGVWWNGKGEFKSYGLILTTDGQAMISTSIFPVGFFPWRESKPDQIKIEINLRGDRADLIVEKGSNPNEIKVIGKNGKAAELLHKQAGKSFSSDDFIRRIKSKAPKNTEVISSSKYQDQMSAPECLPTMKTYVYSGANIQSLDRNMSEMIGLENLVLKGNRLQSLPESLKGLNGIQRVVLAENWFSSLPTWFGGFTQLKKLDISNNAFRIFPDEIRSLKHLEALQIEGNQLKNVPDWTGELTGLTHLNLARNQLEGLPSNLAFLTSLESIDLSYNRMTSIPDCLLKLSKLKRVYLRGNPIDDAYKEKFIEQHPECKRWF